MATNCWPRLTLAEHGATTATLQLWLQIVGKIRLAQSPWLNHSWHVPLYVTVRGLGTGLIPYGERAFTLEFDLNGHRLLLATTDGVDDAVALAPGTIADFHAAVVAMLSRAGLDIGFHGRPNEIADAIPFAEDRRPAAYDGDRARELWSALVQVDRVLRAFRTGFLGKASPVHLFWGAVDLAVTRFSGRTAPRHPGGIANLPDAITREAYSHEVSSAGFWPGGNGFEPLFYSYAYPQPPAFAEQPIEPATARYDAGLGEFVLAYADVRAAADPAATLMRFLQSTYAAAADTGGWDRAALECGIGKPRVPRPLG